MLQFDSYSHLKNSLEQLNEGNLSPDAVWSQINESSILQENPEILIQLISFQIDAPGVSDGIKEILQRLLKYFQESDKEVFFLSSLAQIFNGYQKALLKISNVFSPKILSSLTYSDNSLCGIFTRETSKERLMTAIIYQRNQMPEILNCLQIDYEKLESVFKNRAMEGSLRSAIINDDVEALIQMESNPFFLKNMMIQPTDFDCASFGPFKPIEYAALYGAVKCFKYILLNEYADDSQILRKPAVAIQGGNLEIIKILMEKGYTFNDVKSFSISISAKRNDIFEWLLDMYPSVLKDSFNAFHLISRAMISYNFDAFKIITNIVDPISIFAGVIINENMYGFFYKYILNKEKEKGKLDELIKRISLLTNQWFHREFFPLNLINPNDMYELIINTINAGHKTDLETLLNLNPLLSQAEETEIFNKGKEEMLRNILKFPRFHKFVDISFNDLVSLILKGDKDYLAYLEVERIYNQLDEEGNNLLQFLFGKAFLNPDEFNKSFSGKEFGACIQGLAKKLDLEHKNNNGETAEDLLRKRPYNQASLIMFAEYRKAVPSFPYLDLPICSFRFTHRGYYQQPFYACHTCHLEDGTGACEACVSKCHKDHDVEYLGIKNCFCDCCVKNKHDKKLFEREKDIKDDDNLSIIFLGSTSDSDFLVSDSDTTSSDES